MLTDGTNHLKRAIERGAGRFDKVDEGVILDGVCAGLAAEDGSEARGCLW